MMRRSLAFKWIVTLLLSSLTGVLLIDLFAYRTTINEFDRLRLEQARLSLLEELTAYYDQQGSWEGLNEWVYESRQQDEGMVQQPRRALAPLLFTIADTDEIVQLDAGPFKSGDQATTEQMGGGYAFMIDDAQVGTLLLALPPPRLDPREQLYVDRTNQALLFGALGATAVALLVGLLLSRQFLSPLSELTEAIAAMRQGDLEQKVPVRSRDELGELADTFNEMSAKLHRANQLRKQMTADIAHDLRTPLMVISGYLEGLRDGTLAPTPERFEVMNREATLLKRLIDDLRTLSLADAGELKLMYQVVAPQELLEQLKQSFDPLVDEQRVTLQIQSAANLPNIQVDRERMLQVLTNLVSNALRYTAAGGKITLHAAKQDGRVQLQVTDTGKGIPADQIPNIFERFYRVEESRHGEQGESGLGLAIARSIVEAHQGTIAATSETGTGTTITITL